MPRGAFISYSFKNLEFAQHIAQDLIEPEIQAWPAEPELEPGYSRIAKFKTTIDRMEFLLVFLSPAFMNFW